MVRIPHSGEIKNMITYITSAINSFGFGITLPLIAVKLITSKKSLLLFSLLPIFITILLYWFLMGWIGNQATALLNGYFTSWGWDPTGWLAWSVMFLSRIVLILISAVSFSFTASICASPFNDFLAEKTEKLTTPPLPPAQKTNLGGQIRLIGIDLIKMILAGLATILALLLSLIPVINIIAFIATFLLISFQYTTYPQTRRGVGFFEGIKFLVTHIFACSGFGMSIAFLFMIPILSSLALPLAVVGGTLLVGRAQGKQGVMKLR